MRFRLFSLIILLFLSLDAYAIDIPAIQAARASSSSIKITWRITKNAIRAKASLELYRSSGTGSFRAIAIFDKTKSGARFIDKNLSLGTFRYRARLIIKRARSRWSRIAVASTDSSVTPPKSTPIPTPTHAGTNPTPTPTPTVRPGNFDGAGNVTAQGKAAFGIPSNLSANKNAGQTKWFATCRQCHSVEKTNRNFGTIKSVLPISPMFINLPDSDVANLTAYLNRFNQ
jgi:hypothetical protein